MRWFRIGISLTTLHCWITSNGTTSWTAITHSITRTIRRSIFPGILTTTQSTSWTSWNPKKTGGFGIKPFLDSKSGFLTTGRRFLPSVAFRTDFDQTRTAQQTSGTPRRPGKVGYFETRGNLLELAALAKLQCPVELREIIRRAALCELDHNRKCDQELYGLS